MRLARRLTLTLLAGVLVVVAVYGYIDVDRQAQLLRRSMGDELSTLAHATAAAVLRLDGKAAGLLEEASRRGDIHLELVDADIPEGERRVSDGERLYVYRRLAPDSALRVSQSLAEVRSAARQAALRTAVAAGLIVALGALYATGVGMWLVGRPVRGLIAHLRRVGAGELDARIEPHRDDELGELAREVNVMSERLAEARRQLETAQAARIATLEQLRHAERLTIVGQLAAGVAHELGTPLNVVDAHAKMIQAGEPEPDSAQIISEQAGRMTAIIRQLLDFARRGDSVKSVADLSPLVDRSIRMLSSVLGRRGAIVQREGPPRPLWVRMDEGQIQQVVTNLLLNAVQAMPRGGPVRVRLAESAQRVRLDVVDCGEGIPAEALPRVFDPFFTTKPVGEGTGLGLSVAYGIVREHGGSIEVASQRGQGTTFSIHLPRAQEAS